MKTPTGYKSITFEELKRMSEDELKTLLSVAYKDGNLRCECIGIRNLQVESDSLDAYVNWSDDDGDPSVKIQENKYMQDLYGFDNVWTYGLFKPI